MDLLWRLVGPSELPSGQVALFVDGPDVLRDKFDVGLDNIRAAGRLLGEQLSAARLYLNEHAASGLTQTVEARGFKVIVMSDNVDVKLAVDLACYAVEDRADVIAVASRDTDFKSALETASAHGLRTVAATPGSYDRSDVLQNAATHVVTLDESVADGN